MTRWPGCWTGPPAGRLRRPIPPRWVSGWTGWSGPTTSANGCRRWHDDPAITAELAALHRAWQAAYRPATASAEQLHWHDALARVLTRVQEWQDEARRRQATARIDDTL
jgi:hypothetical protein